MSDSPFHSRTLGEREGAIVAWLEAERRPVVSVQDVAAVFEWTPTTVHDVLGRLERKGWLRRIRARALRNRAGRHGGVRAT